MLETPAPWSGRDRRRARRTSLRISISERVVPKSSLARYLEGWADADPIKIADATAEDYDFYDPLVGHFSRCTLQHYFALLRLRFGIAGTATRGHLAFALRGPMSSAPQAARRHQYWREAPLLGLTGLSEITVRDGHVATETVTYDLNMACESLRGPAGRAGCLEWVTGQSPVR